VAAGAAGAALIYGLISKRIPTDRLIAGVTNLAKGKLGSDGQTSAKSQTSKANQSR